MAIFWRYEGKVGSKERKLGAKLHAQLKKRMELGGLTRSGHRKKIDGVQYEVLSHGFTDEILVDTTGVFDFAPEPIEADITSFIPDPIIPEEEFEEEVEVEEDESEVDIPIVEEEEEEDDDGGGDGRSLMCIFYNEIDAIAPIHNFNFWPSFVSVEDQQACLVLANKEAISWENRMLSDLPNIRAVVTNGNSLGYLRGITEVLQQYPGYTDVYVFHNVKQIAIYSEFSTFDQINLYIDRLEEENVKRAIYNDMFGYGEGIFGYDGYTSADTIGPLLQSRGIYWDEYFAGSTYDIDHDATTDVDFGGLRANILRGLDDMYNEALAFATEHGLL